MNILSIDFDFFQNIPYDVLKSYPDGIDLPIQLSNAVWARRLATEKSQLDKVSFDDTNFEIIKKTIRNQNPHTPIYIASSHKEAYPFVNDMLLHFRQMRTNLINIDLHHDLINENEKVDCGNWIGHLLEEKKIQHFAWIAKKLSQRVYGLSDKEMEQMHGVFNTKKILNQTFDAIFVCRSNPWLHPKFDTKFDELLTLCYDTFNGNNIVVENEIKQPREIPLKEMEGAISCLPHTQS